MDAVHWVDSKESSLISTEEPSPSRPHRYQSFSISTRRLIYFSKLRMEMCVVPSKAPAILNRRLIVTIFSNIHDCVRRRVHRLWVSFSGHQTSEYYWSLLTEVKGTAHRPLPLWLASNNTFKKQYIVVTRYNLHLRISKCLRLADFKLQVFGAGSIRS